MSTGSLAHPEWAPAVAALLGAATLAVALARLALRRRRRHLGPGVRPGLSLARDVLLLLALAAVGVGLLGPRLGQHEVRAAVSGIDLVLLVDVSRSMDATDVPPSRLARGRQAAEEILARLAPGDRAALAFFAGRGVLAAPLTPDRDALAQLVAALDTDLLRPAGSNLGAGMHAALEAFEAGSERPRAIFVISDGEDPEGRSGLGLAEALRAEVTVHAAALGSDAGATVPDAGLPLRDDDGTVVVSRRRTERLERLVSATGGELFVADAWGAFDYDAAVAAVRSEARLDDEGMATRTVRAVQVWPCAALAFALLALEGLPAPRRGRRRAAGVAALAVATLLLVGAGGAGEVERLEAQLRARPGEPRLLIALGIARLDRGQRDEAARAFRAAAVAARDPELAGLAWFDLGVAALETGDLEAAREAFFDALALAPDDREARYNLEWTQQALESEAQPPPPLPPEARPAPAPPPEPEEPESVEAEQQPRPEPSEAERRRWLQRVDDDLSRSLRAAAGPARGGEARHGAAW